MKKFVYPMLPFAAACVSILVSRTCPAAPEIAHPPDVSFQHEVAHAIDRGLTSLLASQNTNGSWSSADEPAVTALVLTALMGEPTGGNAASPPLPVRRGYDFLTNCAKPDGGIYARDLQNYNTSLSVMALVAARDSRYDPLILRARQWIIGEQVQTNTNASWIGGVGYGDHGPYSDMNNTFTALEALYHSKYLVADKKDAAGADLNWPAVIQFIQSCQNLPGTNKAAWVSDDARDAGGFVYLPGESKAGAATNASGRTALRSYGSISYAGLLSYIYADLKPDDPRVAAALAWLKRNYTVEENPGMGPQGYYYYLRLMSKALTLCGGDQLTTADGHRIDWRREAAMKLINLQKSDGSWANANGRWWEKDPALVTAYSVLSLETIYPRL